MCLTKPLPGDMKTDDNSAEICNRVSCETSSPQSTQSTSTISFFVNAKTKTVHFHSRKHNICSGDDFLQMCVPYRWAHLMKHQEGKSLLKLSVIAGNGYSSDAL